MSSKSSCFHSLLAGATKQSPHLGEHGNAFCLVRPPAMSPEMGITFSTHSRIGKGLSRRSLTFSVQREVLHACDPTKGIRDRVPAIHSAHSHSSKTFSIKNGDVFFFEIPSQKRPSSFLEKSKLASVVA
jgi:hypothetical protein